MTREHGIGTASPAEGAAGWSTVHSPPEADCLLPGKAWLYLQVNQFSTSETFIYFWQQSYPKCPFCHTEHRTELMIRGKEEHQVRDMAHTSAPALPSLGRAVWTADGSLPPCRLKHRPLQKTTKSTFKSRPFTTATRLRLHCLLGPELWSKFHFIKFPGNKCVSPIRNYTKNTCEHVEVLTSVGSTSELLSFWTKMKFCPFSVPPPHQLN